jgi:hypothetical protein
VYFNQSFHDKLRIFERTVTILSNQLKSNDLKTQEMTIKQTIELMIVYRSASLDFQRAALNTVSFLSDVFYEDVSEFCDDYCVIRNTGTKQLKPEHIVFCWTALELKHNISDTTTLSSFHKDGLKLWKTSLEAWEKIKFAGLFQNMFQHNVLVTTLVALYNAPIVCWVLTLTSYYVTRYYGLHITGYTITAILSVLLLYYVVGIVKWAHKFVVDWLRVKTD